MSVTPGTYEHHEDRDFPSLIPRPIPSFSILHTGLSVCNIEKLGMGLGMRLGFPNPEDIFPSLEFLKCTYRIVLKYWNMSDSPS